MLDAEEIAVEIARLEYEPSSYDNYHKLAALYIIRDHMKGQPPIQAQAYEDGYSFDAAPTTESVVHVNGDSDFLQAVDGKPSRQIWLIMDDVMNTLAVVNERAYNSVMEQIERL